MPQENTVNKSDVPSTDSLQYSAMSRGLTLRVHIIIMSRDITYQEKEDLGKQKSKKNMNYEILQGQERERERGNRESQLY